MATKINAAAVAAARAGTDESTAINVLNEHKKIEAQSVKLKSDIDELIWKSFDIRGLSGINPNVLDEFLSKLSSALKAVDDVGKFARDNQSV